MELMFANTGLIKIHIALPMTIQFHIDLLQGDSMESKVSIEYLGYKKMDFEKV